MANTYYGSKVSLNANGVNVVEPKTIPAGAITVISSVVPTEAALNDVFLMTDIPPYAYIVDLKLDASAALDSGAALRLDVQDTSATHTFISQTTIGSAAGVVDATGMTGGSVGYTYGSTAARLQIKVHTAAGTFSAGGTLTLATTYTMDP